MFRSHLHTAIAAAVVTALVAAGGAYAVDLVLNPGASAVVIERPVEIKAGEPNPIDFPGVRGDRKGEPLPKGSIVVAYRMSVTAGSDPIFATFTLRCPKGKVFAAMVAEDDVLVQLVGPTPFVRRSSFKFRGRNSFAVIVDFNRRGLREGQTITGTVYGLCR